MRGPRGKKHRTWDALGFQRRVVVEPFSNYFTGRLRRDLRAGQTTVGGIFNAANRSLDEELSLRLRSAAYAGGVDFRREWANRTWSANWQGGVAFSAISPSYEVNDLGFQTSADRVSLDSNLSYEQIQPGRVFRRLSVHGSPDATWNYGGDLVGTWHRRKRVRAADELLERQSPLQSSIPLAERSAHTRWTHRSGSGGQLAERIRQLRLPQGIHPECIWKSRLGRGSGAARTFQVSDRDFTFRSLRGNAVLRWEWRPGSTLFLVWQQSRSESLTALSSDPAYGRVGNFALNRDARELFGLKPDNIFAIKVTCWLNP